MRENLIELLHDYHEEELKDKMKYCTLCKELKDDFPHCAGIIHDIAHEESRHAEMLLYIIEKVSA